MVDPVPVQQSRDEKLAVMRWGWMDGLIRAAYYDERNDEKPTLHAMFENVEAAIRADERVLIEAVRREQDGDHHQVS